MNYAPNFPIYYCHVSGRTSTMAIRTNVSYTRMLLACLVIISAAYWAGGRWGPAPTNWRFRPAAQCRRRKKMSL